jgi:hypothetical protein
MNDNAPTPKGVHELPRSYDIFSVLKKEREYQTAKWGNEADDTMNTPNDFVSYISNYSTRWFKGGFAPYDTKTVDEFRISMLKTAALAIAAVESIDRQREEAGHTFFEVEGVRD